METTGKKFLVTGAAGFIGSHLSEALLAEDNKVVGVDRLSDYYPPELKRNNLSELETDGDFEFLERNLLDVDWPELLPELDAVFHQAAQAGVRASWGSEFDHYLTDNIKSTQLLLEEIKKNAPELPFVMASSSSVYGIPDSLPMHEEMQENPYSPYGVTKLAAENLALLYGQNYGLSVAPLRYFTVYGPRQRPDMAFSRFFTWIYNETPITVFDDGTQTRDFTFVDDVVAANLAVLRDEAFGQAFNVGGGTRISLNELLELMEVVVGQEITIEYAPARKGDVPHTAADTSALRSATDWEPAVDLKEGLSKQWDWIKNSPRVRAAVEAG